MSALEIRIACTARIKANLNPRTRGSNTHYALHRRRTEDREPLRVESRQPTLMELVQAELDAVRAIDLMRDEDLSPTDMEPETTSAEADASDYRFDDMSSGMDDDWHDRFDDNYRSGKAYTMQDTSDDDDLPDPDFEEDDEAARADDMFYGNGYIFLKNSCGCRKASLDPDREVNATSWRLY